MVVILARMPLIFPSTFVQDLIILTSASQGLSLVWGWLWLLLVLAPLRAALLLWTSVLAPWIFQPAEEDPNADKKAKKLDRKMKRAAPR
jgi:hypothetical protein